MPPTSLSALWPSPTRRAFSLLLMSTTYDERLRTLPFVEITLRVTLGPVSWRRQLEALATKDGGLRDGSSNASTGQDRSV